MKALYTIAVALPLLALAAPAQDNQQMKADLDKMIAESKAIGVAYTVTGSTVKGAPYSGVEVTETNQVLADGTRIHNESQTQVYRDSEGRVRRETPTQITIMDPVAKTSYILDPKSQTARRVSLALAKTLTFTTRPTEGSAGVLGGVVSTRTVTSTEVRVNTKDGVTTATVNGQPVDPAELEAAKKNAESQPLEQFVKIAKPPAGAVVMAKKATSLTPGKREDLGKQTIEGVLSEGTRFTNTLEVGAIGNDRPIQEVNERWYSSELQTAIMTKRTDPRTGEETFRLTNVSRSEPAGYLFQVPTGYQLNERE